MMNEYLCKFEERLCRSGSPLSELELVEEHMSNKSQDFDEESFIIDGDDLNSNTETEKNSVNELQILYMQCSINCSSIGAAKTKRNLPWSPLASDLTMDNLQKVVPCELFNVLAWVCGFSSEPTSIAQDLVNLASGGRNHTPRSMAVAMALTVYS